MFLEQWNEDGLQALSEETPNIQQIAEGLACFQDASRAMRGYFESGDTALADEALSAAYEGHERLQQLYLLTAQKIEELNNEIG